MSTEALEALVDHPLWTSNADGLFVVNGHGEILVANRPFEVLFGFEPGGAVGQLVESLVPEESRQDHTLLREGFAAAPSPRTMGASRLLDGLKVTGETFPITISLSPVDLGDRPLVLCAVRDLSDRMAVEARRAEAERLRTIAEDHDRIGRELHDSVIQHLFAIGLRLQGLPRRIDDDDVIHAIHESVDAIDSVIDDVRSSIHGLRAPSTSAVRRVQARILEVVAEMTDLLPEPPSLQFDGAVNHKVDEGVVNHLIAALREALSNAGRHSGAKAVSVVVSIGDTIVVEVADDGTGIPEGVARSGIANLEARARALGGTLELLANEPMGTILRWTVPNGSADQVD